MQFNREGDDAAARPGPAAPEDPKESCPSEQARTAGKTNGGGVPAFITATMKQKLKARGFSDDDLFAMNPQRARDILADENRNAFTERYNVGSVHYDRYGSPLDYDGPAVAVPDQGPDPLDEHGAPAEAAPADIPPPSDPVERWRTCFARLDPRHDPCAGFRAGDWARIHGAGSTFLAGHLAKLAADAGWSDLELVGVHPEVGVARPNACGALMTNAYGSPVTQVTPQLIRFANGLAVYKARLSVGNSVAVWDYREPAANECPLRVSPPRPQ